MATGKEPARLYDSMDKLAQDFLSIGNKLDISTKFCGTRDNPHMCGSISNIGVDNFKAQYFIVGILQDIARELHDLDVEMMPLVSTKPAMLIGSGNAMRMNITLQGIVSNMLNMSVRIPLYTEEAAYGAALFAFVGVGRFNSEAEAQTLIRYK